MNKNIYQIDASSRVANSASRYLNEYLVSKINRNNDYKLTRRDVGRAEGVKFLDEASVEGFFIPETERSDVQRAALEGSDQIVREAFDNDIWAIGLPIYNFSAPASFKAWADMLARSNKTFKYIDGKPVGLLQNKCVFIIVVSGGTEMNSEVDFCTPWLRQYMRFIGIENLHIIDATRYSKDKEARVIDDINKRVEQNGL